MSLFVLLLLVILLLFWGGGVGGCFLDPTPSVEIYFTTTSSYMDPEFVYFL